MKVKHFLVIGLLICATVSHGQTGITDVDKMETFKIIPKETVFIHQNASTLFAGEKLFYKMYCLIAESNRLSPISKIGYVELVGSDKRPIFKHKVKLANGLGQGDFFIPANIPTGNYKLVGYTRWMKNNPKKQHFTSDVNIINLYRTNPNSLLIEKDSIKIDTLNFENHMLVQDPALDKIYNSEQLKLTMNKKKYQNREKVSLSVTNLQGKGGYGNYSITVKMKDEIVATPDIIIKEPLLNPKFNTDLSFPELRGVLISGQLVPKKTNMLVENKKVALSVPGKDFLFKLANTNFNGEFYFSLDEAYDANNIFVQIFEKDKNDYKLILREDAIDYEGLEFNKLTISEEKRALLLRRNIHNQIENAYVAVKQDEQIPSVGSNEPFYRNFDQIYRLDDYTRFSTIKETLVEIIEDVWIRKDRNGNSFFHVRGNEYLTTSNFQPLVIVDGVMLQNHSDILDVDARRIRKISIARGDYEFALQLFKGIIAFETFDGKTEEIFAKEYIQKMEVTATLPIQTYFRPSYDASNKFDQSRVPDYRYQLLWLPNLRLRENIKTVEFYTSDVRGTYEIYLKGFTVDGTSVSIRETFDVK